MKLRNKKTGEIFDYRPTLQRWNGPIVNRCNYNSLAELNEEWEDYKEPKEYWYIDWNGEVCRSDIHDKRTEQMKLIGNYFESEEEAEKAVEKLEAWRRLKDEGFEFTAWKNGILLDETIAGQVRYEFPIDNKDNIEKYLDLLFGGEE